MFKIQQDIDQYRIVAPNGDASEVVNLGELAELETGGHNYISLCDEDPETGEFISLLEDWVMRVVVEPAEVEDVEFDKGDDDVEVEEGAESDGEDEEVEVEE
jgi:hypothetical protein